MKPSAKCDHKRWVYPKPIFSDWTGEYEPQEPYQVFTTEDIDVGRFHCTQCGEVGYYTGLWRDFWEQGIPCPGSEGIDRGK